jgi:meiotically up-regulated gene 157 (Mug157) protein
MIAASDVTICYLNEEDDCNGKISDKVNIFDPKFKEAMQTIIELWKTEQRHHTESPYSFLRLQEGSVEHGQLYNGGKGMPVNYTGMTWSGFRPSDDACTFGYLIPSNMFAVTVLKYMEEIAETVYKDDALKKSAAILGKEIDYGIKTYGIYHYPKWGKIYAYETDGFGNYILWMMPMYPASFQHLI